MNRIRGHVCLLLHKSRRNEPGPCSWHSFGSNVSRGCSARPDPTQPCRSRALRALFVASAPGNQVLVCAFFFTSSDRCLKAKLGMLCAFDLLFRCLFAKSLISFASFFLSDLVPTRSIFKMRSDVCVFPRRSNYSAI